MKQPGLGLTRPGCGAEGRTIRNEVGRDPKGQAGTVDPGMVALRDAAVTGERKAVPKIGLRAE